jgi:hypothetical protein
MLDLMTVSEGKSQVLYSLLTHIISSFLAAIPRKSQRRGSSCWSFLPDISFPRRYHKSRYSGQNHFEEGEAWLRYAPHLESLRYLVGGSQSYPAIQCCRISLTTHPNLGGQRGWRRRHRGHRCRARHDLFRRTLKTWGTHRIQPGAAKPFSNPSFKMYPLVILTYI